METQNKKILKKMAKNPKKRFIPTDFMKPRCFVWYSAGARMSTLLKLGLLEKRIGKRKTMKWRKLTEYKITTKGQIVYPLKKRFLNPYKKCNNI